jgi:hypothetical protein
VASSGVSAASSTRTRVPMPASICWMPPLAIVLGPAEVPFGEKGCLARATRSRQHRCIAVLVRAQVQSEQEPALKRSVFASDCPHKATNCSAQHLCGRNEDAK